MKKSLKSKTKTSSAKKSSAPPAKKKSIKVIAKTKKASKGTAKVKKTLKKKASADAGFKPIKTLLNKSTLIQTIVERSEQEPKVVKAIMGAFENIILGSICPSGAKEFMMPGLFKIVTVKKPASKGGVKKPNPFKPGEMMVTKAKPATVKTKIRPLAKLKAAALG